MENASFQGRGSDRLLRSVCAAVLCLLPLPCPAQAASKSPFVQKRVSRITAGTTVTATFRRRTTAGNLIVAYVVWDNGGATLLSDNAGDAYASAVGPTQSGGDPTSAQIFYAANIAGGTTTVAATFATAITTRGILYLYEYSGADRTAPVEAAVAASGSTAAMDSGALTASPGGLLFVGAESNRAVTRRDRAYRVRSRKYHNLVADRSVTTGGSYHVTATQKGSAWIMQLVDFKASGSTPPNTA
jgi:hypothetical protein